MKANFLLLGLFRVFLQNSSYKIVVVLMLWKTACEPSVATMHNPIPIARYKKYNNIRTNKKMNCFNLKKYKAFLSQFPFYFSLRYLRTLKSGH